jgi:ubiquinone/menaquinone biosynthesis C-methylase UbiE
MPSLSGLTPAERARLLGKPEGELGIAISGVMNQTNAPIIEAVYRRLGLQTGQCVLEIGFGNGRTVPMLMQQAERLTFVGIDIAETMVAEATAFNRQLIDLGYAKFHLAPAEAIPCADASVDRACAINVVYFWPDPVKVLSEIRRVLRPGGFSVIAGIDIATAAEAPFSRAEFGFRARDVDELIDLHRAAGFEAVEIEPFDYVSKRPDGTPWPRHYDLAIATR